VPSASGPADLLAELSHELARLRVPWYVSGAQAVLIWGRPRLTTDVDVTVRLGSLDSRELVSALQGRAFDLRIVATPEFVRQARVLPLVHQPTGLALDVVLAGRPKDIDDIRGILMDRAGLLDLPLIHRTLAVLEEALGQPDLVPLFEAEVERSRGRG
jgi:hypothetical protein